MAGDYSDGFKNAINDMVTGSTPATGYGLSDLTECYIALVSTVPDGTDVTMADLTELSSTNYQRVAISADFATASAVGIITSDGDITFAEDTAGDFGVINGWVIVSGATKGVTTDKIFAYNVTGSQTPNAGDTPTILATSAQLAMF